MSFPFILPIIQIDTDMSFSFIPLPRLTFLSFNYAARRGHRRRRRRRRLLSMTIHMASVIMISHDSKALVDFLFVALKLHNNSPIRSSST